MSFDHWKTTDPDDEYLEPNAQPGENSELAVAFAALKRLQDSLEHVSDHSCVAERMEFIRHQGAEIERLKQRVFQLEAIIEFGAHITLEQYWSLLRRAADALESNRPEPEFPNLIAEMRKAAE